MHPSEKNYIIKTVEVDDVRLFNLEPKEWQQRKKREFQRESIKMDAVNA